MYLLTVFSKREFLLEREDNCKTLSSLMEAINYLIAYHDESNHYLQIQLMKYQASFEYLESRFLQEMEPPREELVQEVQEVQQVEERLDDEKEGSYEDVIEGEREENEQKEDDI